MKCLPKTVLFEVFLLAGSLFASVCFMRSDGASPSGVRSDDASPSGVRSNGASPSGGNFTEMAYVMLGGFRGILSEIVWFQADRLESRGEYSRLAQIAACMTRLEPHTPEVWCYAAWNLAFNVSASMPTAEERWNWVKAGLDLLKRDALALNPANPVLAKEVAWIYLVKLSSNLDDAADYYRREYRREIEEKGLEAAGFERYGMEKTEKAFGEQDWGTAEAAALYHLSSALDAAKGREREDLLRMAFQALLFETVRNRAKLPKLVEILDILEKEFNPKDIPALREAVANRFKKVEG